MSELNRLGLGLTIVALWLATSSDAPIVILVSGFFLVAGFVLLPYKEKV